MIINKKQVIKTVNIKHYPLIHQMPKVLVTIMANEINYSITFLIQIISLYLPKH